MANTPGGQTPVTRERFEQMKPREQGVVVYMQGAWNPEINDRCPYIKGTKEYDQFAQGSQAAMISVQDCEDD